ncbi:TPA: hypothetical protein HA243_01150 [Candidatus Micrarchaeota archaeon]|nr:hypothetical protein [Candidatus Micrarchaeota archaeon]
MKRSLLLAFALLSFSGMASAVECGTIYDCGYRENCKAGVCVFDGLSCKYDTECDPFEFCNTGAYQCQVSQGRCHTSSDCPGGEVCDANNYCADQVIQLNGNYSSQLLNNTTLPNLSGFGSTDPKLNKTIQKIKSNVDTSIAQKKEQSRGSVGGFFDFFFEFLRRLFGG